CLRLLDLFGLQLFLQLGFPPFAIIITEQLSDSVPLIRLNAVLFAPPAGFQHFSKGPLCSNISVVCGFFVPKTCLLWIFGNSKALVIKSSQPVLCGPIALFS